MVRVLVVEDEANIRDMIALNLRHAGMEVVEAESAEAALPLLAQKPGLPVYSLAEARNAVSTGAEVIYLGWIMAGLVKGYAVAAKRYRVCAMLTTRRGLNSLKSLFQQKKCC